MTLAFFEAGLPADEVDGRLVVPDLLEDPDHHGVGHGLGLGQAGHQFLDGVDDPFQGVLVVHPGEFVLLQEISSKIGIFPHPLVQVLGAIVEVEVTGAHLGLTPLKY